MSPNAELQADHEPDAALMHTGPLGGEAQVALFRRRRKESAAVVVRLDVEYDARLPT